MKTILLIAAGLLLVAAPTQARIGETRAQCYARYGTPEGPDQGNGVRVRKGDVTVLMQFIDDVCHSLSMVSVDNLSQAHVQQLLSANSGGLDWKGEGPMWQRSDGATAHFFGNGLLIESVQWQQKEAAKKKEQFSGF